MPFKNTYRPGELEVLHTALKDHCAALGIPQGSRERENAAVLVMRFYDSGVVTTARLIDALSAHRSEWRGPPDPDLRA